MKRLLVLLVALACCAGCDITNNNDGGDDGMTPGTGSLEYDCTPCGDSSGPVLTTVVDSTTVNLFDLCYSIRTKQCYYDCPVRDFNTADRYCHDGRP